MYTNKDFGNHFSAPHYSYSICYLGELICIRFAVIRNFCEDRSYIGNYRLFLAYPKTRPINITNKAFFVNYSYISVEEVHSYSSNSTPCGIRTNICKVNSRLMQLRSSVKCVVNWTRLFTWPKFLRGYRNQVLEEFKVDLHCE